MHKLKGNSKAPLTYLNVSNSEYHWTKVRASYSWSVSREFEPHQRLLLLPWASHFTFIV